MTEPAHRLREQWQLAQRLRHREVMEARLRVSCGRRTTTPTPQTEPSDPARRTTKFTIDRKVGSAIICEGDRVLGVFTTIDALRALHGLLERTARAGVAARGSR